MAAEPIQGLRYPAGGDEPDGPAGVKNLADDVVKLTNMRFASVAARDATLVGGSAPVDGMECFTGSGTTEVKWLRHNGQWVRLYESSAWVDISITGFTGSLGYRKYGNLVQVQGEITGTFSTGSTNLGQMPSELIPSRGNARGAAIFGGGYPGASFVTTSGAIGVTHQTGASRNNPSFTIIYMVG
ncbi:hypothetical protein [Jonesia denitrificans]|uniref:Uncharacterized protein n=1 Tax=Jonesia denitrificans (strain ATCC 14870 / DSM 20603 / BCRC 15368 / CIP 55.134 / JCM 11481 / NBRC 15587 / NCTC 10816 / Prevot 55134) TaxID=471856 RepID=C7R1I5_JONDD|nr:hypothetical protein [Jonesia denitrificans]ACV09820.1 hypothetical protein Jden_2183 [Jonesia denitrificans DSM 20603]ASE08981.2 hypothetical protein CEP80_07425 [Jonesia denitrificans]QXB43526.1 hypothetical protein I6L70_01070 [Jonesia denitrificans]SQH22463.1 Uncharacterised protein [Jonesia denitrificans]